MANEFSVWQAGLVWYFKPYSYYLYYSPSGNESTGWKVGLSSAILSGTVRRSGCCGTMGSIRTVHSAHVGRGGRHPHLTVEGLAAFFDTKCKPDVWRSFRFRNILLTNGLVRAQFITGPQPLGRLPFTTSSVPDVDLPGAPPPGSNPWKPFTTIWLLRGIPGDNAVDVVDTCCSPSVTGPLAARICL